jgi:hypothetical protein
MTVSLDQRSSLTVYIVRRTSLTSCICHSGFHLKERFVCDATLLPKPSSLIGVVWWPGHRRPRVFLHDAIYEKLGLKRFVMFFSSTGEFCSLFVSILDIAIIVERALPIPSFRSTCSHLPRSFPPVTMRLSESLQLGNHSIVARNLSHG